MRGESVFPYAAVHKHALHAPAFVDEDTSSFCCVKWQMENRLPKL